MASVLTQWKEEDVVLHVELVAQTGRPQVLKPNQDRPTDWREEIKCFLRSAKLPEDPEWVHLLKQRATHFIMIEYHLYKRAFSRRLLKCLSPEEVDYVLRELHQGSCESHVGERTLDKKAILKFFS